MTRTITLRAGALCTAMLLAEVSGVAAQTLGVFRWQFAPYCNVVAVTVVQQGSGFSLSGHDERCGAATRSAVSGTAHLNPNGSIGMALTIVRPDGFSTPTQITLPAGGFSGTWSDSYGTSGSFVFAPPASPTGSPRPLTIRGTYAHEFVATGGSSNALSAITFGVTLPNAPLAPNANIIAAGGTPTGNCPGNSTLPEAAPGHLCVYERQSSNIGSRCVIAPGTAYACQGASPFGAAVYVLGAAAGRVYSVGSWAVTLP